MSSLQASSGVHSMPLRLLCQAGVFVTLHKNSFSILLTLSSFAHTCLQRHSCLNANKCNHSSNNRRYRLVCHCLQVFENGASYVVVSFDAEAASEEGDVTGYMNELARLNSVPGSWQLCKSAPHWGLLQVPCTICKPPFLLFDWFYLSGSFIRSVGTAPVLLSGAFYRCLTLPAKSNGCDVLSYITVNTLLSVLGTAAWWRMGAQHFSWTPLQVLHSAFKLHWV